MHCGMLRSLAFASLTAFAVHGLAAAVQFSGPGGDVASPANWGGTLPAETAAVSFPAAAVPSDGLSLSADVAFGETTFAAGSEPINFSLGGFSYASSGRIILKSSVSFTDGGTVSMGGGRIFDTVRDLSLRVTDAATFQSGDSLGIVGSKGVSLSFDGGATLDCTQHSNYNIAFYVQGSSGVDLLLDNATAELFTVNIGGKDSGLMAPVSNLNWTVRNGARVTFHERGNTLSRGVFLGSVKADGYSISNRVTVSGATFDLSKGDFRLCGIGDRLSASNATFKAKTIKFVNARDCEVSFADSTVTGAISFDEGSRGNILRVADCASFPSVTIGGVSNRFILAGGAYANLPTFAGSGVGRTFEIAGGSVTNTLFTFSGTNVTVVVRNGGRLQYGEGGVTKDRFNFMPGATKDFTLRIADGGTVGIRGMVNFSGNGVVTYDWTNCPNSAIEFTGRNPSLVCHDYWHNYETICLGTTNEVALTDAVALRYVIPEGGYAAAPIRNEIEDRGIWIFGNQPIEIRLADGFSPSRTITVPLIYDANGFRSTPMDAARIAKLTANATFPDANAYRTTLFYDSDTKTLAAKIRPLRGTVFMVR